MGGKSVMVEKNREAITDLHRTEDSDIRSDHLMSTDANGAVRSSSGIVGIS